MCFQCCQTAAVFHPTPRRENSSHLQVCICLQSVLGSSVIKPIRNMHCGVTFVSIISATWGKKMSEKHRNSSSAFICEQVLKPFGKVYGNLYYQLVTWLGLHASGTCGNSCHPCQFDLTREDTNSERYALQRTLWSLQELDEENPQNSRVSTLQSQGDFIVTQL